MNKNRLAEKYTDKELAASFVFRTKLSAAQKAKSDQILSIKRKKMNQTLTANELLLSQILQLKYQIEDYLDDTVYDARRSFGYSGSRGTYAPPALRMPRSPITIKGDRSTQIPTNISCPTPSFCK
jgi:hypothetical protein